MAQKLTTKIVGKFVNGFAKVCRKDEHTGKTLWGVINQEGVEVMPVQYEEVWNLFRQDRQNRPTTWYQL